MRTALLSVAVGLLLGSLAVAQAPPAVKKPPAATPAQPAPGKPAPAQAAPATPRNPAPAQPGAGQEDAVRKASQAYIAALNAGDFKTAAQLWTADGQFVDRKGTSVPARQMVAQDLPKKYPAGARPQLILGTTTVKLLTESIAQEEGSVDVKTPDGEIKPRGRFNAMWVKQGSGWLLKNLRELRSTAIEHLLPLTDLAWLVGSWAAEADGDDIYLDCSWSPSKVYLMRDITIMRDGKVTLSVRQRIGLDPLSPRIKSWSFDADGGLSEAFWDKIGDNWYVASRGASPGGDITTARTTYSDITADSFTVESAEAHAGSANPAGFKLKFTRDTSLDAPAIAGNTANPATPTPTTPVPASSGTDSLDREKILNSPEWRQTQQAYHEWLSVQKIYTPAEVAKLKAETAAKINSMSTAQLRSFLDSAREKIQILMSTQAEDARLWLAQRMAVEVRLTPEEIKKERPDIPNMTAAQLELRLKELEQQRQQTQGAQQAFNQGRQFRIKSIDQQQQQANDEREQALNRAADDMSGYGGYYGGGVGPRDWGGGYRNYGGYRW